MYDSTIVAQVGARPSSFMAPINANQLSSSCLRAPFGGYKDSGIGREGGRHSREFFTEAKTVVIEI